MRCIASLRKWLQISNRSAGSSLIELLVSLGITGAMLAVMASFFQMTVATRHDMSERTEAEQGLRALLASVTQEVRQAGACLPQVGRFIALEGVDNGAQDSLTVRIGRVDRDTRLCVVDALTVPANIGDAAVTVADADKFHNGDIVYVSPTGVDGEFYTVASAAGATLTLGSPLADLGPGTNYAVGTGVFALEERTYAVDAESYGRPVLTVSIDAGEPQPLVDGVEEFDVQYHLGPCNPECESTVALPESAAEWLLVTEIGIKATVRSRHVDRSGELVYATTGEEGGESEYLNIKPRNFLRT